MSSEIHIVAIITPAEGKESRVKELLIDLGNKVKQHEKEVVCSLSPSLCPFHLFPCNFALNPQS
jgi:hypothetical protein